MDFPYPIVVSDIAKSIKAKLVGDPNLQITGINEIHKVRKGDITFVDIKKYYQKSLQSSASAIIINQNWECPPDKVLLICKNPFEAYEQIVGKFYSFKPLRQNIASSAKIHNSTILEPNVVIGEHVEIGPGCHIQSHVYIGSNTTIGSNVSIQAGTMIGTDAFYFKSLESGYKRWKSAGHVIIEDNVFIGACCTINRGVSGETLIGTGSKLDSQVHVGHGVVIGKHCLIAGQVGIGGKTIIGDYAKIYGQVGIVNNLVIGDHVVILAQSGVGKDLESGKTYFGSPAVEARERFKEIAILRQLTKK